MLLILKFHRFLSQITVDEVIDGSWLQSEWVMYASVVMGILLYQYFVAMAIYCCSPAAYKALKDFNILSLPAKSILQSYSGAV